MSVPPLRQALMQGTRPLHMRLDQGIGALQTLADYQRFLIGSQAFRTALEPALRGDLGWLPLRIAPALGGDLADLGLMAVAPPPVPALPDLAAQAGALYVAEGSGLGARLLLRRAQALGLDGGHGARHLAVQTAEPGRWPRFLAWLEATGAAPESVQAAANRVFDLALEAYGLAAHDLDVRA